MAEPYLDMYNRSKSYLQKAAIKKAYIDVDVDAESFRMPNPQAERWLLNFSSTEIQRITEAEMKMVREALAWGQKNLKTHKETAKEIQKTIGLTDKQYGAWTKYRNKLIESGMKLLQVDKATARYYNRMLKYRAETIALTESHTATNRAWHDSVLDAVRQGAISSEEYEMYWLVAPDERLCDQCAAMAGATSPPHVQDFNGRGIPPLHPRCRCTTVVRRKR